MTLQVAAGILVAAFVLALIGFGANIALDRDTRNLDAHRPGYFIALTGVIAAVVIIYLANT